MKKNAWRIGIVGLFFCFFCLVHSSAAELIVTEDSTVPGDVIYIAGNPDCYPVEYYRPDTGRYEGILPEILKKISDQTGIRFAYVQAGEDDRRAQLAKNGQVEIVSGYQAGEDGFSTSFQTSVPVFTLTKNGERAEFRFLFTEIATADLKDAVDRALASLSQQEIAEIGISHALNEAPSRQPDWLWIILLAAVIAALTGIVLILALRLRNCKRQEERDRMTDPGTGIGNKAYFTYYFKRQISDQNRAVYCVAYVGFDIDRVNRYYGVEEAENQLRYAANELTKHAKDQDIVARVSGGGFAVAHVSCGEAEMKSWVCDTLRRLNRYGEKFGKDYRPDFRCGIYFLTAGDRDCDTVLYNAKQGYLCAVKENTAYHIAHSESIRNEKEKVQLQQHSVNALQNQEFQLFLQFFVNAEDATIAGAEALARWEHPQKGLLLPSRFIEGMAKEGTIAQLDFYMFEESCAQLQHWQKNGEQFCLSCNFARSTIDTPDFVSKLAEIAQKYRFDYGKLIIEITEEVMENNEKTAYQNISRCKQLGFQIALDDIGSGVTSFSDLRDYPIDIVKFDKSILKSANTKQGIALLTGMIALAHSLDMKVLCEGVETTEEVAMLRRLGSDYLQGYYFFRAMPKVEADRYLHSMSNGSYLHIEAGEHSAGREEDALPHGV